MSRDYLDFGNDDYSSLEQSEKNTEEKLVENILTSNSDTEKRMWVRQYLKVFPGQQERLKQLISQAQNATGKIAETLKHAGDRIQEEGEKIIDNAVKVSDKANEELFDGLNKAADKILEKSGEIVDKVNKQIDIAYENASEYEIEHGLAKNFDEDAFVKLVLDRKITFTARAREEFDFVTPIGTRTILTSEHRIFKFEILSKLDGSTEHFFKINNIDCTTHLDLTRKGIRVNLQRLHNVIVNGEDKTGVTDVSL